jgi:cysteine-rich repeat protein
MHDLLKQKPLLLSVGVLAVLAVAAAWLQPETSAHPPIPGLPGSTLAGQAVGIDVNIHTKERAEAGVIITADEHNIVSCGNTGTFDVLGLNLENDDFTRFWIYEYTGNEPPFDGRFFISDGELNAVDADTQQAYEDLITRNGRITEFIRGRTYYVMSEVDLKFTCGSGVEKVEVACASTSECLPTEACTTEYGVCNTPPDCRPGQECLEVCYGLCVMDLWGNSEVEGIFEQCDDGNRTDGDGCSEFCIQEVSECGNNVKEFDEECDDGNLFTEDGCNAVCDREDGWSCEGSPSECSVLIPELVGGGSEGDDVTLSVAVKSTGTSNTAVKNQKGITLLRFQARAENGDVVLTRASFSALAGSLVNAFNYTLLVDTNDDGEVETILESGRAAASGRVTFSNLAGGGFDIGEDEEVSFEVRADVASSFASEMLQLQFDVSAENYLAAEGEDALTGIETNGTCDADSCRISVTTLPSMVWNFVSNGSLSVVQDATPVRNRQFLGGALGETAIRLQMLAWHEDIDVTDLQLSVTIPFKSTPIDRLELYREGDPQPFATATIAGCGSDQVPTTVNNEMVRTFCANMDNRQLVVPEDQEIDILVRPRMKSDTAGGTTGNPMKILVQSTAISDNTTGRGAVRARGDISSVALIANDGDANIEGEVFIGTSVAAQNKLIVGPDHVSVLAKISSIINASPDADGSGVPIGLSSIGQFRFSASPNDNANNGLNKVMLSGVIFNVNATNVAINAQSFTFANKADTTTLARCAPLYPNGAPYIDSVISGNFFISCSPLLSSGVDTAINPASNQTFVISANVVDTNISPTNAPSTLQVSLQKFTEIFNAGFSTSASHISWVDRDIASWHFRWIEYPDTVVKSTTYSG